MDPTAQTTSRNRLTSSSEREIQKLLAQKTPRLRIRFPNPRSFSARLSKDGFFTASTAKRGRVVESMHVALSRNETQQNFNIWVYGDERLVRGSGLFVGETGIAVNHHFLAPRDGSSFRFTEGRYRMDVFAQLLGDRDRMLLFSQTLEISPESAAQLAGPDCGLYFDWGPDSSRYLPHVDKRPPPPNEDFLELLNLTKHSKSRSGA